MIKYAHTNIITDDWKKLSDFYIAVFGCLPIPPRRDLRGAWLDKATGIKDAHLQGIHLALPGYEENLPSLEIFQYDVNEPSEQVPNRKGFGHIAFGTDDVPGLLATLIQHGGSRVGEMVETHIPGAGNLTFVYARDPDGNIIELQNWK
jgi:catechol 2,3-dioxygenase-like lactoylglutathione lyase family enzyme